MSRVIPTKSVTTACLGQTRWVGVFAGLGLGAGGRNRELMGGVVRTLAVWGMYQHHTLSRVRCGFSLYYYIVRYHKYKVGIVLNRAGFVP